INTRVIARVNKDGQLVIAMTELEVTKGTNLSLVAADGETDKIGFGPIDADPNTVEHVAVLTARYPTDGPSSFFTALASALGLGPVAYDPVRQVYTYNVNVTQTYALPALPFSFNQDLGPFGSASLNGNVNVSASVTFNLTLGFDLSAREVPRIL